MSIINNTFPFMNLIPKQNSEFSQEYTSFIPSEGEIRLIANRNRECQYYYLGIQQCRKKMIYESQKEDQKGFLPCKRLVDAHYRCMTEDNYGNTLEEVPEEAQQHSDKFLHCAFKELEHMQVCRKYFDAIIRVLYRQPDTKLVDYN